MTLLSRVRRTLHERDLLPPGTRVVVACSGGPDSVSMLHALSELAVRCRLDLRVCTVDHGLRPEAPREVDLVRRLSVSLGLPFETYGLHLQKGAGLQERARQARYAWLAEVAKRYGATRIAVGHTRDDQAETVLGRMLRGAGLDGLSAISPLREDGVVRPLIDCDRGQVLGYLRQHRLEFTQDPSNCDLTYTRTRIRHSILPMLRSEDGRIAEHLADLADDARDQRALIGQLAEDLMATLDPGRPGAVDLLRSASGPRRRLVLRHWLRGKLDCIPGRPHVQQLEKLVLSGGEVRIPGHRQVTIDAQGALMVSQMLEREERSN